MSIKFYWEFSDGREELSTQVVRNNNNFYYNLFRFNLINFNLIYLQFCCQETAKIIFSLPEIQVVLVLIRVRVRVRFSKTI